LAPSINVDRPPLEQEATVRSPLVSQSLRRRLAMRSVIPSPNGVDIGGPFRGDAG